MSLTVKVLEVRDRATFVPVFAIGMATKLEPVRWYLDRTGYVSGAPDPSVLIGRLDGTGRITPDPYQWEDRTMQAAHLFILKNWWALNDGSVVDVEHILGETKKKKESERFLSGRKA